MIGSTMTVKRLIAVKKASLITCLPLMMVLQKLINTNKEVNIGRKKMISIITQSINVHGLERINATL
jgi:hypothetical protein